MQSYLPARLIRQSPLLSALLALLLPLCLLAGGLTAAVTSTEGCQPQAVTPDFCTKVTHQTEIAAVVPEAVVPAEGGGLIPHLIWSHDTPDHRLPGYLTTPSGRSPPRL